MADEDASPSDSQSDPAPAATSFSGARRLLQRITSRISFGNFVSISIAVISLYLSIRTNQVGETRELRGRLTDTLNQATVLFRDNMQLQQDIAELRNSASSDPGSFGVFQSLSSSLSQQNVALLQQARQIIPRIPADEVQWIDHLSIATMLFANSDYVSAEPYYRDAVAKAPTPRDEALGRISYAGYLYATYQPELAQEQFNAAINLLNQEMISDDLKHVSVYNALTQWMAISAIMETLDTAEQIARQACDEAKRVTVPVMRRLLIRDLNLTWQGLVQQAREPQAAANVNNPFGSSSTFPTFPAAPAPDICV